MLRARPNLLRGQVATSLRAAITSGLFPPGNRLNEIVLARQIGVSRGPLREALRQLEAEGFIHSTPNRGTFVAMITTEDVIEVLTLRERVEPLAIELSLNADDLVPAATEALRQMQQAVAAGDTRKLVEAHVDFHGCFYQKSGHRLLHWVWERLRVPLLLYLSAHQTTFRGPEEVVRDHEELLEFVRSRDAVTLRTEIAKRIRENLRLYRNYQTQLALLPVDSAYQQTVKRPTSVQHGEHGDRGSEEAADHR